MFRANGGAVAEARLCCDVLIYITWDACLCVCRVCRYKCQICGGYSYRGPRNFERHFTVRVLELGDLSWCVCVGMHDISEGRDGYTAHA
jgi:hypothetical protein